MTIMLNKMCGQFGNDGLWTRASGLMAKPLGLFTWCRRWNCISQGAGNNMTNQKLGDCLVQNVPLSGPTALTVYVIISGLPRRCHSVEGSWYSLYLGFHIRQPVTVPWLVFFIMDRPEFSKISAWILFYFDIPTLPTRSRYSPLSGNTHSFDAPQFFCNYAQQDRSRASSESLHTISMFALCVSSDQLILSFVLLLIRFRYTER